MPTLITPMTIQGIHGTEDASEELESVLTPAQLKKLDLMGNVPAQLMTGEFILTLVWAIAMTSCFVYRDHPRAGPNERAQGEFILILYIYIYGQFF